MHEVGIDSDKHLSDEPCDLFILFILLMKLFKKKANYCIYIMNMVVHFLSRE